MEGLLTCESGSMGERTSCLRPASRAGLAPLLGDELVFDSVLRSRPGDGRLDEGVSGLPTGMVSSACAHARESRSRVRCGVARGQAGQRQRNAGAWRCAVFRIYSLGCCAACSRSHGRVTYQFHLPRSRPCRAGRLVCQTQSLCCCQLS